MLIFILKEREATFGWSKVAIQNVGKII